MNMHVPFTLIIALLIAAPVDALAQAPARMGILVQEMGRAQTQAIRGLSQELKRLGYADRKNLLTETRNVKANRAALQPAASELVAQKVSLIFTTGTSATRAAMAATTDIPIVFVTGHGDVPTAVSALKGGAVDFIQKPFGYREVLCIIERAFERDAQNRARRARHLGLAHRVAALTGREREVMRRVVEGKPNKVIAEGLDISVKTVEFHRAKVMEKMGADSVAALVQLIAEHDAAA